MSTDSSSARHTGPWARLGGVLLLLVADGLLALALVFAIGWDRIAAHGFRPGLTTHAEFTAWIVIFACWTLLMAVPAAVGLGRRRAEFVAVQVLVGVTVLAFWIPTVRAGWHDLHVQSGPTSDLPVAPHPCTGHAANPCPGG